MTLPVDAPEVIEAAARVLSACDESSFVPPMLPAVALEALALARDRNVDLLKLGRVVERDQVLASRFLMVANSPAFRSAARVTTMSAALLRLGLVMSRDLVFFTALEPVLFTSGQLAREMLRLRDHSLVTAAACGFLARSLRVPAEEATLAGLLHDLGAAATLAYIDRRREDFKDVPAGSVMAVVERTHEAAGRIVARRWALPPPIAACIAGHHAVPDDAPLLVRLTAAADELAELSGSGWRVSGPSGTPTLERLLGDRLAALATRFDGQLRGAA